MKPYPPIKQEPSFRNWFARHRTELDALVLDIDGVLLIGDKPYPNAVPLLDELRSTRFPFTFLTNDAHHSHEEKIHYLGLSGLPVKMEEIVSCGDGITILVESEGLQDCLFFLMGDLGKPCFAKRAGLRTTRDPSKLDDCRGIIIGERNYDWEICINAAINYFMKHPDGLMVVPNPDDYYMIAPDKVELASGSPALLITHVLARSGHKVNARYLGKPHEPIFDYNHRVLEKRAGKTIPRNRVLMLGDSLHSDMPGAVHYGYRAGLILTGITRASMLAESTVQPELVFVAL